jgi:hypothetical protein
MSAAQSGHSDRANCLIAISNTFDEKNATANGAFVAKCTIGN